MRSAMQKAKMSETLADVENKILGFSFEEQLSLLSYLTEAIGKKAAGLVSSGAAFRRPLGSLEESFFMAEDFGETPDSFKEYMYLLDTNSLIYSLCSPSALSDKARRIVSEERDLNVSITSFGKIAIKQGIGKLSIKSSILDIERICLERSINIIPITAAEIEGIKTLPPLHKDPFDRLIVSQARINGLCIVTSDGIIPKYDVETAW